MARYDSSLAASYYKVHARNDPNMRADAPIDGPADRIPAWNHGLAVANGTIVLAFEVLVVIGFLGIATGVLGEISYWHVPTAGAVASLRGRPLIWYWIMGMPQAFFPFLAETMAASRRMPPLPMLSELR